jgi:hypothetical protein
MEDDFPILVVDPPEGWKYGFPRPYSWKPSRPGLRPEQRQAEMEAWFKAHGYPQKLIDQGMLEHLRFWNIYRDQIKEPG